MTGNWGDDTYVRNNSGDVITELSDQGIDTVEATISTRLGDHLEHLSLLGTNAINGTGNSLNNTLRGNSAANTLDGQTGTDSLIGGRGNDTYLMKRGYGQDLIIDTDSTVGHRDTISFGSNIRADQLWLSKSGLDLTFTIIGTKDSIRIKNYYQSAASQIEQFTVSSGQTLSAANVDQLVSAMAQLTPPTLGQTSLSSQQQTSLNPVFAATWA
jgi:Ca2+-binding RTX toxin-like protein